MIAWSHMFLSFYRTASMITILTKSLIF